MDFSNISIDDKPIFDKYLKLYQPAESELTFTNLFMWRHFYHTRYSIVDDMLCIMSTPFYSEPFVFFPIGDKQNDIEPVIEKLKEYFKARGLNAWIRRVPEEKLDKCRKYVSDESKLIFDMNNSDYVYASSDLIHLKGRKYDGKRNHINNFKRQYDFEYKVLDTSFFEECRDIMERWCAQHSCEDHKEFYCERLANMEVLDNYEKLHLRGGIVMVDGKYEGFTTGEMLNDDTAVIHIEKADSKINGLYTFINREFAEKEWSSARYINREQDLGVEGLRKSKLSYNPVKMIRKYSVNLC